MNRPLIIIGKVLVKISKIFNFGNGSTWPGHIALYINADFINEILKKSNTKVVVVAGTNGKTTTGKLIETVLKESGKTVSLNQSGANLLNGIASSIIKSAKYDGKVNKDFAIFEVDENTVPSLIRNLTPDYIIALNLFRDQLDRYGEVDTIAKKWKNSFEKLPVSTTIILNADDPMISYLGEKIAPKVVYFGLDDEKLTIQEKQDAADSIFCPFCSGRLIYKKIYFSHLGEWRCEKCKRERPKVNYKKIQSSLAGTYNGYNLQAAAKFAKSIGLSEKVFSNSLINFKPAFGRQETIIRNGKKIKIFLSKNPTSFNETLRTIRQSNGENLLIVLNDRIPDGKDVSWIWDTDLEGLGKDIKQLTISGDRAFDMGLRAKYAGISNFLVVLDLKKAIEISLEKNDELFILPTYSAMLEVRKILTGKKIL